MAKEKLQSRKQEMGVATDVGCVCGGDPLTKLVAVKRWTKRM